MFPALELARLFVGASLLGFASYTDWRWRRAPNVLWLVMAGIGALFLGVQWLLAPAETLARWPYLVGAVAFVTFVYALWWFGLIAGGADAKALMAAALLVPFPLELAEGVPLVGSPMPGSFVLLGNSLVVFMILPLALLLWNLAHGHVRLPHAFLGVKRRAADVQRGHQWPMEVVAEDGSRRTRLFASRLSEGEIQEQFARIEALGDERVWVTPKIPFMIPLLVGYVLAFTVGDLLLGGMSSILLP